MEMGEKIVKGVAFRFILVFLLMIFQNEEDVYQTG